MPSFNPRSAIVSGYKRNYPDNRIRIQQQANFIPAFNPNHNTMKTCLQCERSFRGRADKRYCSDSCRAQFNNQQRRTHPSTQQRIHQYLKQNHSILSSLLQRKNTLQISEMQLIELGFRMRYITHWISIHNEQIRFGCYEFEWKKTENGMIEIQKSKQHAIPSIMTIR